MSSLRVLIVDDEENVRLTLSQALEDLGMDPEAVGSGREALRRLRGAEYDLALLDLKMPGLSGIDVLRQLRREAPDLPVVILTAHGSIERAVQATRLGAADFIQKPISLEELRGLVRRVLERSTLRSSGVEADSYDDLIQLARWHIQQQQFRAARRRLKAATSADPTRPEAHTLLGVLAASDRRIDAARRHYQRALEVDPDAIVPQMHLRQLESGRPALHLDRSSGQKSEATARPDPSGIVPRRNPSTSYRVLACINEDEATARAVTHLAATSAGARKTGELVLLRVLVVPWQLSPSQAAATQADTMQQMQKRLNRLVREGSDLQCAVQTVVLVGHSVEQLVQNVVEEESVAHVVLGWSEHATLRRVAERVSCELTAVRPGASTRAGIGERSITALIDSSPHAPYVARRGLELAQGSGVASLTLLNVQARGDDTAEALQRRGQHVIWSAAERAGLQEGQYAPRVTIADDVKQAVVDAARRCDTVCVGATRSTALTETIFGSAPRRIITQTGCEVVIARGPQRASRSFIEALGNRLSGR